MPASARTPTSYLLRLAFPLAALAIALASPRTAHAKGTYFLIELDTGVGESAYRAGPLGLTYGASFGTTWKWKLLPVRFALLGTVVGRNGTVDGYHAGLPYSAERTDVDLYVAERNTVPVWRFLRLYFEFGLGQRRQSQVIRRAELGTLTSHSNELLLVLAGGVEARVSSLLSLGVRLEVTPLDPDPDLATIAANLPMTNNRMSLMAQLGVHF